MFLQSCTCSKLYLGSYSKETSEHFIVLAAQKCNRCYSKSHQNIYCFLPAKLKQLMRKDRLSEHLDPLPLVDDWFLAFPSDVTKPEHEEEAIDQRCVTTPAATMCQ